MKERGGSVRGEGGDGRKGGGGGGWDERPKKDEKMRQVRTGSGKRRVDKE